MSRSKSRQTSRQTSGSGKRGTGGAGAASRTTAKAPVKANASATTEEKQTTANRTTVKNGASTTAEEKQTSAKGVPAASASTKSLPPTPRVSEAQVSGAQVSGAQVSGASTSRALSRDAAKYERRQAERQSRYLAQRRARRNKMLALTIGILAVVLIAGGAGFWIYQTHQPAHASTGATPTFTPYQEAIFDNSYPPVDNVYCDQLEQSVEHIHVYLDIWINNQQYPVPANIGIPQDQSGNATCFYWLHVHPQYQNVIHIEAPTTEPFTLGQFIDEWNQQFNSLGFPSQLLLNSGWTIWVNGQPYHGSLSSVPLDAHNIITIAYNSPNAKPMTTYAWNGL